VLEAEALVKALQRRCADGGVFLMPGTPAVAGEAHAAWMEVSTPAERIRASAVVNAAGLYADEVSRSLGGDEFAIYPCRGDYAELAPSRRDLIRGLVYPLPDHSGHGLGVHFTRTTWGTVLVGPTACYVESKTDYETNRETIDGFSQAARTMLPSLRPDDLRPAGSGIRPKLHPAGSFEDFLIARDTKIPRLIHAAGIDSPGLTACLAIGTVVARLVREVL
jgi:glycerol-3-phosphate dehydrogenase